MAEFNHYQIFLTLEFKSDLKIWQSKHNKKILDKIDILISEIIISPFKGIGKPEHLKHIDKNTWSRRITREHRLVYTVNQNIIRLLSCHGHYN